jgi:hypothetical protein
MDEAHERALNTDVLMGLLKKGKWTGRGGGQLAAVAIALVAALWPTLSNLTSPYYSAGSQARS